MKIRIELHPGRVQSGAKSFGIHCPTFSERAQKGAKANAGSSLVEKISNPEGAHGIGPGPSLRRHEDLPGKRDELGHTGPLRPIPILQ
jgi:hypothetical protein